MCCPSIFNCQRSSTTFWSAAGTQNQSNLASVFWLLASSAFGALVGLGRLELPTSSLSGTRSSHLSYRPGEIWWSWSGSNRRPPECKSGALPAELQPLSPFRGRLSANRPRGWKNLSRPIGRKAGRHQADPANKPQNSKWRSEASITQFVETNHAMDWKGCHLLPPACACGSVLTDSVTPATFSLRKEVIQPQVLLRLPCYDFTPIMSHTLGRCLSCELACRLLVQPTFVM